LKTTEGIQKPRYQIWAEAAGVVPSSYKPLYVVPKADKKWAEDYIDKLGIDSKKTVGVGTTACDKRRSMSKASLEKICIGIKERGLEPLVLDPTFHFEGFKAANGIRVRHLMALVQRLSVVVTADSGLLHVAGTLDVPVVGLFGPTDPDMRMGQYKGSAIDSRKVMPCAPCWYNYPCLARDSIIPQLACLNKIDPSVVVEEVLRWHNECAILRP